MRITSAPGRSPFPPCPALPTVPTGPGHRAGKRSPIGPRPRAVTNHWEWGTDGPPASEEFSLPTATRLVWAMAGLMYLGGYLRRPGWMGTGRA